MVVIGKSKSSWYFDSVKSVEVDYGFNKKSWMTIEIFEKWLKALEKSMKKQCQEIVFPIDIIQLIHKTGEKL